MQSPESRQIAAALACRARTDDDATPVAEAVVLAWQDIDAALAPIIGHGGVAALCKRSLHLAAPGYPWLAGLNGAAQPVMDVEGLSVALSQQSVPDAAAGAGVLLQTFNQLLCSLVGSSLTERLLQTAWANLLSGPSAQDIFP